MQADRQSRGCQFKILWVVANIAGGALGIVTGISIVRGLSYLSSRSAYYENTSGFPKGWSFYAVVLIYTLIGALCAVIGYILRQRLVQQRFAKNNATWYALAGAVSWPIIGVLFVVVIWFIIAPLFESIFQNAHEVALDLRVWLSLVLASIVLALPVGLAVAILRRKEVGW